MKQQTATWTSWTTSVTTLNTVGEPLHDAWCDLCFWISHLLSPALRSSSLVVTG